ncbi:MAG TPA: PIN domain-containing protein [Tepidisphaeraceae bacterium]|nr:PIN domain-containing protein [Tepidisphaeraceae bacterium]
MFLHFLRALFILLMAAVGWAYIDAGFWGTNTWLTMAVALCVGVALLCVDIIATRRKLVVFAGVFFGLIVGISIAYGLSFVVRLIVEQWMQIELSPLGITSQERVLLSHREQLVSFINTVIGVASVYLSISFILQTKDDFRFIIPYVEFRKQTKGTRPILLDTSVLIDGRICDIVRTGIIESQMIVPRFVLQELQALADSDNALKRNRGRHGLDALKDLKTIEQADVVDYDASGRQDGNLAVDEQLLHVAKDLNARILTNDLNLNKVAGLRGVNVVNLNDLANAVKPVVLPGERMKVRIVKPGEESGQGVGYLDDGTMVVVEQARTHLNGVVEFTVTNTRQTSAGKMIFGRMGNGAAA